MQQETAVVNGIGNTKFQKVNLDTYFKKGRNLDRLSNSGCIDT